MKYSWLIFLLVISCSKESASLPQLEIAEPPIRRNVSGCQPKGIFQKGVRLGYELYQSCPSSTWEIVKREYRRMKSLKVSKLKRELNQDILSQNVSPRLLKQYDKLMKEQAEDLLSAVKKELR